MEYDIKKTIATKLETEQYNNILKELSEIEGSNLIVFESGLWILT